MATIKDILKAAIAFGAGLVALGSVAKFYLHHDAILPADTSHRSTTVIAWGIGLIVCAVIILFSMHYIAGIWKTT